MTTGTLSVDHVYLVMAYCSNIERSEEEPTARLRRLATLRKRKQRAGATEEAKTVEKLRCKEQKQRRDLDESEREARLMKKRKQMKEYRDKETSLRRSKRLDSMIKKAEKRIQREDSEDR